MCAVRILGTCLLYIVISVATETISEPGRKLFDNDYLDSNHSDLQRLDLFSKLENSSEKNAAHNDGRRKLQRTEDLEDAANTKELKSHDNMTSADQPIARTIGQQTSDTNTTVSTLPQSKRTFDDLTVNSTTEPRLDSLRAFEELIAPSTNIPDLLQTDTQYAPLKPEYDMKSNLLMEDNLKRNSFTTNRRGYADFGFESAASSGFELGIKSVDSYTKNQEDCKRVIGFLSYLLALVLNNTRNVPTELESYISKALVVVQSHLSSNHFRTAELNSKIKELELALGSKHTPSKLSHMVCKSALKKIFTSGYCDELENLYNHDPQPGHHLNHPAHYDQLSDSYKYIPEHHRQHADNYQYFDQQHFDNYQHHLDHHHQHLFDHPDQHFDDDEHLPGYHDHLPEYYQYLPDYHDQFSDNIHLPNHHDQLYDDYQYHPDHHDQLYDDYQHLSDQTRQNPDNYQYHNQQHFDNYQRFPHRHHQHISEHHDQFSDNYQYLPDHHSQFSDNYKDLPEHHDQHHKHADHYHFHPENKLRMSPNITALRSQKNPNYKLKNMTPTDGKFANTNIRENTYNPLGNGGPTAEISNKMVHSIKKTDLTNLETKSEVLSEKINNYNYYLLPDHNHHHSDKYRHRPDHQHQHSDYFHSQLDLSPNNLLNDYPSPQITNELNSNDANDLLANNFKPSKSYFSESQTKRPTYFWPDNYNSFTKYPPFQTNNKLDSPKNKLKPFKSDYFDNIETERFVNSRPNVPKTDFLSSKTNSNLKSPRNKFNPTKSYYFGNSETEGIVNSRLNIPITDYSSAETNNKLILPINELKSSDRNNFGNTGTEHFVYPHPNIPIPKINNVLDLPKNNFKLLNSLYFGNSQTIRPINVRPTLLSNKNDLSKTKSQYPAFTDFYDDNTANPSTKNRGLRQRSTQQPETSTAPPQSQLLTYLNQKNYTDNEIINVLEPIAAAQPELQKSIQQSLRTPVSSPFPWKPSTREGLLNEEISLNMPENNPPDVPTLQYQLQKVTNYKRPLINILQRFVPDLEDTRSNLDFTEFESALNGKTNNDKINIYLATECKDFTDEQKRFLFRLLKHFKILHPDVVLETKNIEQLLLLIIRYFKDVSNKIDVLDQQPKLPTVDEKLFNNIYNFIKSELGNSKDAETALDMVIQFQNKLRKLGQDFNKREVLYKILLFVNQVIKKIRDSNTYSSPPHSDVTPPLFNPLPLLPIEFATKIVALLASTLGEAHVEIALARVKDYTDKLNLLHEDFSSTETLELVLLFVYELIENSDTIETSGILKEFLIKLHEFITSSVASIVDRETIKIKAISYIVNLVTSGVDLTNKNNLNLVIKYVNTVMNNIPSKKPGVDEKFLTVLYDFISSSVTTLEYREILKIKAIVYIKDLLQRGVDLTREESLNHVMKYLSEIIKNIIPPKKPGIDKSFMVKLYDFISSSVTSLEYREIIKMKVISYIEEMLKRGVDLTKEENLNDVIKYLNEIIKSLPPNKPEVDKTFLVKLNDFISSSVTSVEYREIIKMKVISYIEEMLKRGVDLTKEENLNDVIKYLNEIIKSLPPNKRDVDKNFLVKLYDFISSSVTSLEYREIIKMKAIEYITNLLQRGIDLTRKENLNQVIKYVNENIANLYTAYTEVKMEILKYAYKVIYNVLTNTAQRNYAIQYLHEYIKWAAAHNFDINDREKLNQLILLVVSCIKNNDSVNTLTNSCGPPVKTTEVEITFTIAKNINLGSGNLEIINCRVPYITFVNNLKNILLRNPTLRTHQEKFENELFRSSNITELSSDLHKLPKDQLIKMISRYGSFVDAKIREDKYSLLRNGEPTAEIFRRTVRGLEEMINNKDLPIDLTNLRTTPTNVADKTKHLLVIHHNEPVFDPVAYMNSIGNRRFVPYEGANIETNPSNALNVSRRASVDNFIDTTIASNDKSLDNFIDTTTTSVKKSLNSTITSTTDINTTITSNDTNLGNLNDTTPVFFDSTNTSNNNSLETLIDVTIKPNYESTQLHNLKHTTFTNDNSLESLIDATTIPNYKNTTEENI